jgi:hypothetical protein
MVIPKLPRGISIPMASCKPSPSRLANHVQADRQFTISSAPEDPFISVHIRQVGDFTKALGIRLGATDPAQQIVQDQVDQKKRESWRSIDSLVSSKGNGGRRGEFIEIAPSLGKGMPMIKVDGPFGAPAEDVFKSEVAVLVGAGIGVTVRLLALGTVTLMRAAICEYIETYLVCPKSG